MKSCKLKECKSIVYARGLCRNHYQQALRHGDFDEEMLDLDYTIYPEGYADKHRPSWHGIRKRRRHA